MIIRGDARAIPLRDRCVQTCVTSPPYFGLRDYGVAGQIGLEKSLDEHVAAIVAVFREVRRVLRDDGTVWLNLGDSFASFRDGKCVANTVANGNLRNAPESGARNRSASTFVGTPIKHKDLCGIPWRVAFALQADGWWLRSDIVWAKPNPMPESVTDRPTRSHEYVFLLAKSATYFYDADAIRETAQAPPVGRPNSGMRSSDLETYGLTRGKSNPSCSNPAGRNKRDVWTVASESNHWSCCKRCFYAGEHFPTRNDGVRTVEYCPACGREATTGHFATFPQKLIEPMILAGSRPGDLVLDPFLGSGTTGVVCERLGRRWAGLELSEEYIAIARNRTKQRGLGFRAVRHEVPGRDNGAAEMRAEDRAVRAALDAHVNPGQPRQRSVEGEAGC